MQIKKKKGAWSFSGKGVAGKFEKHIEKSVPFYLESHNLIISMADFFLFNGSRCYDLGSSTGNLLHKLSQQTNKKKIDLVGIETEPEMVKFARKKNFKNKNIKISFIKNDIKNYKFKNSNLILSFYTMQFIHPSHRQKIFNKIYKTLNYGGAFIIFEKVRGNDARFDNIINSIYLDFKEKNKFNHSEILNKSKSLRGVLEPFTDDGNLGFLKRAGFIDIQTIFQFLNFKGYLCIK